MAHAGLLPPIWDFLDKPFAETLHLLSLEEFTEMSTTVNVNDVGDSTVTTRRSTGNTNVKPFTPSKGRLSGMTLSSVALFPPSSK